MQSVSQLNPPRCQPLLASGNAFASLFQRLKNSFRPPSQKSFRRSLRRRISGLLCANCKLQIIKFSNDTEAWWYAYDPQTQQHIYATTEDELDRWIERISAK